MKLKFNSDAWYNGIRIYEAGKVYDVSTENGFAARWIKRGAEEVVEKETPKVEIPAEIPAEIPVEIPQDLDVEIKKEVEETEPAQPVKRGKRARSAIEEL